VNRFISSVVVVVCLSVVVSSFVVVVDVTDGRGARRAGFIRFCRASGFPSWLAIRIGASGSKREAVAVAGAVVVVVVVVVDVELGRAMGEVDEEVEKWLNFLAS